MKRTLLLFVTASAMLYGCSTDPEMNDVQISAAPTTQIEETLKPLSFEQTQQIVAAELGEEVASRIAPTSRHVRFTFDDQSSMLSNMAKGEIDFFPTPIVELPEGFSERSNTMYALLNGNTPLPQIENCKVEVVEEYYNPLSPISGLTEQQADLVAKRIREVRKIPETRVLGDNMWQPNGTIKVYDPILEDYVPAEFVAVKLTGMRLTSFEPITATCITDRDGKYRTDSIFYGPAYTRLLWGSHKWSIFTDGNNMAQTLDTLRTYHAWNFNIDENTPGHTYEYATIHRAISYMYNTFGYKTPYHLLVTCWEQAPVGNEDDSFLPNPLFPRITLYSGDKDIFELYCEANRLVGMATHFGKIDVQRPGDYNYFTRVIKNSWGEFSKYIFPETYYRSKGALLKLHTYTTEYGPRVQRPDKLNRQGWCYLTSLPADAESNLRTPLFIDIWDDFNQIEWPELRQMGDMKYPRDNLFYTNISKIIEWSELCPSVASLKATMLEEAEHDMSGALYAPIISEFFNVYSELENAQPN